MLIKNLDNWDKHEFNEHMEYSPDLQRAERQGSKKVHTYADFMLDIFGGLYKYNVDRRDPESAPEDEKWADNIYEEISNLPEWKKLRERTKMNSEASAAATASFCEQFMQALPNQQKQPGKPPQIDPSQIDMSKVRKVAREACGQAAEEADKTNDMIQSISHGSGVGNPKYASPTMKKEIARRLQNNYTMKRIAELAGRMRRIAAAKQKEKTRHGCDEITNITIGDDLSRLIPAEIAKLAHPLLELEFQRKFLERQLLQYQLRGNEKQGKGPIVVCVDESSSMSGERDIWAKAVCLALLYIAQQQNRMFALVHYNRAVTRTDFFEGKSNPSEILDAISYFSGGGTNFMEPLNHAVQIISNNKAYKKADVIFITDGSCTIQTDWLELFLRSKEIARFNVTSIVIDGSESVCSHFSDTVHFLDDVTGDDRATLQSMFSI